MTKPPWTEFEALPNQRTWKRVELILICRPVALGVIAGLLVVVLWIVTLPAY